MSKSAFMLRLPDDERARAKKVADEIGLSENRLYTELIHDGLLMREQMLYVSRLRDLATKVSREDALAILDRVPDIEPVECEAITTANNN